MQNVKDSDAVKNVMTMTKEQADKLIAEHGPEVMNKMMTVARMQAGRKPREEDERDARRDEEGVIN